MEPRWTKKRSNGKPTLNQDEPRWQGNQDEARFSNIFGKCSWTVKAEPLCIQKRWSSVGKPSFLSTETRWGDLLRSRRCASCQLPYHRDQGSIAVSSENQSPITKNDPQFPWSHGPASIPACLADYGFCLDWWLVLMFEMFIDVRWVVYINLYYIFRRLHPWVWQVCRIWDIPTNLALQMMCF